MSDVSGPLAMMLSFLVWWFVRDLRDDLRKLRKRVDLLEMKSAGLMTLDEANSMKGVELK